MATDLQNNIGGIRRMSGTETKRKADRVVRGRHVTLFDAIEGRVIKKKAIGFQDATGHSRLASSTNQSTTRSAATPEDSLAVRLGCQAIQLPIVDQSLQAILPKSSLLNALHAYTACFYEKHNLVSPGFDESALLALGMFAEESVDALVCNKVQSLLKQRRCPSVEPS